MAIPLPACTSLGVLLALWISSAHAAERVQVFGEMCIISDPDTPKIRIIQQPGIGTSLRLGESLFLVHPDDSLEVIVGDPLTDLEKTHLRAIAHDVQDACSVGRDTPQDGATP